MCDPVSLTIASIAIAGGSAGLSYSSNRSQAKLTQQQNDQYYSDNKQAAIDSAELQNRDLEMRQSEDLLATATAQQDVSKQERSTVSTARTSAAEAGISGHSVDALVNDIEMQGSTQRDRLAQNGEFEQSQLEREKQAILVNAQSQINGVRRVNVQGPSIAVPLLQTAGAAVSGIDKLQQRNAAAGNSGGT